MLPKAYLNVRSGSALYTLVLIRNSYYEKGKCFITPRGQEILREWGKMNGMSFNNPKFKALLQSEQREKFLLGLQNPVTTSKGVSEPPPTPYHPLAKAVCQKAGCHARLSPSNYKDRGNFCLTCTSKIPVKSQFTPVHVSYSSYLRTYKKKLVKVAPEVIRERMRKEIADRKRVIASSSQSSSDTSPHPPSVSSAS